MSDEIKVKFGGDFSELSKGAKEAAEAAGVAKGSLWFTGMETSQQTHKFRNLLSVHRVLAAWPGVH